jgi:hypothetical protein
MVSSLRGTPDRRGDAFPEVTVQIEYADDASAYRPGACNIGPDEIARRRRIGLAGVATALVVAVGLLLIGAPPWLRLLVFPPLAGGIVSLEQARRHFCASFAMAGIRNFGPLGGRDAVVDAAALAADRRAALLLFGYSSAIAGVITLAFVAIPV